MRGLLRSVVYGSLDWALKGRTMALDRLSLKLRGWIAWEAKEHLKQGVAEMVWLNVQILGKKNAAD